MRANAQCHSSRNTSTKYDAGVLSCDTYAVRHDTSLAAIEGVAVARAACHSSPHAQPRRDAARGGAHNNSSRSTSSSSGHHSYCSSRSSSNSNNNTHATNDGSRSSSGGGGDGGTNVLAVSPLSSTQCRLVADGAVFVEGADGRPVTARAPRYAAARPTTAATTTTSGAVAPRRRWHEDKERDTPPATASAGPRCTSQDDHRLLSDYLWCAHASEAAPAPGTVAAPRHTTPVVAHATTRTIGVRTPLTVPYASDDDRGSGGGCGVVYTASPAHVPRAGTPARVSCGAARAVTVVPSWTGDDSRPPVCTPSPATTPATTMTPVSSSPPSPPTMSRHSLWLSHLCALRGASTRKSCVRADHYPSTRASAMREWLAQHDAHALQRPTSAIVTTTRRAPSSPSPPPLLLQPAPPPSRVQRHHEEQTVHVPRSASSVYAQHAPARGSRRLRVCGVSHLHAAALRTTPLSTRGAVCDAFHAVVLRQQRAEMAYCAFNIL